MKAIIFLLLFIPSISFAADPWSKTDIVLETTYQILHFIDWGQTRNISNHPEKYRECNPILGEHPSIGKVNTYFLLTGLLHLGVTHFLPAKCRPYFHLVTIPLTASCVINNFSLGLKIDF